MIYQIVTETTFSYNQAMMMAYSFDGVRELYHYLTDFGSESEPVEFDPIAIISEFTEYASFEDVQKDYDVESIEDLENKTIVLKFNDGLIIKKLLMESDCCGAAPWLGNPDLERCGACLEWCEFVEPETL